MPFSRVGRGGVLASEAFCAINFPSWLVGHGVSKKLGWERRYYERGTLVMAMESLLVQPWAWRLTLNYKANRRPTCILEENLNTPALHKAFACSSRFGQEPQSSHLIIQLRLLVATVPLDHYA